ncbi:MAG: polyprenyl synthetase family protein [Rhodobacter sp.]|uniref:polyprenyl synthetase family protein n=1 Tax=Pararhodobacter sp. TaxID=2127056 RepID=UPI001D71340E|nr:polyprenyl synthetase family protein [Pararhodobacter sp.]MCB1346336.1 polyprenyl synthetase family protein [Paracoccaceae bacterium]MCC0072452.1 polyprenyl synthetase family protein [Rhodobacter sp.]HPD91282.1 polyprenyl synthetase family protein [Pararhodobacter sp.]
MSFTAALDAAARAVSGRLDTALAALPDSRVRAAMGHALVGGKGLRGFLVLESGALHGVARDTALTAAAAIEAMHAYSLVHDDLPAMDDDDLRRGRPTVHVAYDEATAILAGDALQALAFELAAGTGSAPLVAGLARAAGAQGMVLGQALDIAAETAAQPLTLAQITHLQQGKTGALFGWSCTVGPVLAGADPAPLADYARALGLAFQIADDILDHEGDEATAGKRLNKDAAAGKATFVSLLGLEPARARAAELTSQACDALASYGDRAATLRDAARFVISRDK